MTATLIVAIYLIGFALTLRRFIPRMLASLDRAADQAAEGWASSDTADRTRREKRQEDRPLYLAGAFMLSLFWPFVLTGITFWRLFTAGVDTRTPAEISQAEREELEKLRRLAREYDLPAGEHRHKASCHGARGELQCGWDAS